MAVLCLSTVKVLLLLLLSSCSGVQSRLGSKTEVSCSTNDLIRLDVPKVNSSCDWVEGRVQFCEESERESGVKVWKSLCDDDLTVEDAQVLCRSLNYSAEGARRVTKTQNVAGATTIGVNCNGTEPSFSDCPRSVQSHVDNLCEQSSAVICFIPDTRRNCSNMTPSLDNSQTTLTATSAAPTEETPVPTKPDNLYEGSSTNTTPHMQPKETDRPPQRNSNKLAPPILYYFIGGVTAIIFTGTLLVIVALSVVCCYLHYHRCASKIIGQGSEKESIPSDHPLADLHGSQVFKERLDTIV